MGAFSFVARTSKIGPDISSPPITIEETTLTGYCERNGYSCRDHTGPVDRGSALLVQHEWQLRQAAGVRWAPRMTVSHPYMHAQYGGVRLGVAVLNTVSKCSITSAFNRPQFGNGAS